MQDGIFYLSSTITVGDIEWSDSRKVDHVLCRLLKSPHYIMAERLRPPDSSSGVSDQQSVGSSPGRDTCVLKQDT